jgi:hypothetical protein
MPALKCKDNEYLVPAHCRKKPNRRSERRQTTPPSRKDWYLSETESGEIREIIRELEPQVRYQEDPTGERTAVELGPLVSPELIIDDDTQLIRESRFFLPFFFGYATTRFMDPKIRKETPDPNTRYEALKNKFSVKHNTSAIPLVYKYVVLRTCLHLYGKDH